MGEFREVFRRRTLKVKGGKSMVMRCRYTETQGALEIALYGLEFERVNKFRYLGSTVCANGGWKRR